MSDEAFEKWYSNATATWRQYIDPKEHARLAWSESRRQRDAELQVIASTQLCCLVTGNQCGTDTWVVGRECKCLTCQLWLARKRDVELSEPQTAETCQHEPMHPKRFLGTKSVEKLAPLWSGDGPEATVSVDVPTCLACQAAREAAERAAEGARELCADFVGTHGVVTRCDAEGNPKYKLEEFSYVQIDLKPVANGVRALDLASVVERAVRGDK